MIEVVTDPAAEPVSVAEAKQHLRVDIDDDDALIASYVTAARQWCESFLRRALVTQTLRYTLDEWPDRDYIVLPRPPLQSITSLVYIDDDGNTDTVASATYHADTARSRLYLANDYDWPTETLRSVAAVQVTYVAGYGGPEDVPQVIKSAILLALGDLYEMRENTVVGAGNSALVVPFGVQAMLWPYRSFGKWR